MVVPVPATPGSKFYQEQQESLSTPATQISKSTAVSTPQSSGRPKSNKTKIGPSTLASVQARMGVIQEEEEEEVKEELVYSCVPKTFQQRMPRSSLTPAMMQVRPDYLQQRTTAQPQSGQVVHQATDETSTSRPGRVAADGAPGGESSSFDEDRSPPNLLPNIPHHPRRTRDQPIPRAPYVSVVPATPAQGPAVQPTTIPAPQAAPVRPVHFDNCLEINNFVKEWDGNPDTLPDWVISMNILSNRIQEVWSQLGEQLALYLTGSAKKWFEIQSFRREELMVQNWYIMCTAICDFFMIPHWLNRQKLIADKAKVRQPGHESETPTGNTICKKQIVMLVNNYSSAELIERTPSGAPQFWRTIIGSADQNRWWKFLDAVKQHEKLTEEPFTGKDTVTKKDPDKLWEATGRFKSKHTAKSHAVQAIKPKHPPDDKNVSKHSTPEQKGARGCKYCGSNKHWDKECKFKPSQPFKPFRAKARFATETKSEDTPQDLQDSQDHLDPQDHQDSEDQGGNEDSQNSSEKKDF
ncbi:hypothetical protein CTheo_8996 [Ceratobasidium theobromae]|uniref:Uncharacterized protein n=1 Tax=Ceratobasidium theobromae TaxID=1582974 RepID=A0A5N5Q718_9AGAM|nr:hypothetical protein CTheo_8996 [Ceratobasidium theobromae]